MKNLQSRILELLKEVDETPSFGDENSDSQENSEEQQGSETQEADGKGEDKETEEEKFEAKDFKDFLSKTNTEVTISFVKKEPAPIFGSQDIKKHNRYKVTLKTKDKGQIWFYFWDSIANTNKGVKPTVDDVMTAFGVDIGSVFDGASLDQFKIIAGYEKTENSLAQDSYNGCIKILNKAKKLFDEPQIKRLVELANDQ